MQDDESKQIGIDDFCLRAPAHDFGEVISDNTIVEDLFLFDEKEFYLQINQPDKLIAFVHEKEDPTTFKSNYFLTREWDPDTWQFGPITEIQVPKNMKAVEFGKYLQSKVYPHIAPENMFGTKISFLKSFVRSDLAMRSWSNLITTHNTVLASSKLELTKDALLIVVRDWSKTLREQLNEEELRKYTNSTFVDHIKRKSSSTAQVQHKRYDGLLEAT